MIKLCLDRLLTLNPRHRISVRLSLTTAGTVLFASTLLSLLVGYIGRAQMSNLIERSLKDLAHQMADKLDRGMFERYQDIEILSTLDQIRQSDYPIASKRSLLNKLQQTYPNYAWIGLTAPQGKVLASTGKILEGKNVAKRPWYQLAQAKLYVGDVHEAVLLAKLLPNSTGEPLRFVDVAAPIIDDRGKFQGVIGAHLSWAWAKEVEQSLLLPSAQYQNAEIFIADRNGTVLLGSSKFLGKPLKIPNLKSTLFSQEGHGILTWSDSPQQYVTAFARTQGYGNYPGLGWIVVVRQRYDVALAAAKNLQWQVFFCGTGLGGLFAIWSWRRSLQIVNPIVKLTTAANLICSGNLQTEVPIFEGQDELSQLAKSLKHLVDTLERQQQDLKDANQQLQLDLQHRWQREQQIQEQAALLDVSADAIFVQNLDGKILYWNQGAERVYGWHIDEACGQPYNSLLYQDLSPLLDIAYETVCQQGEWRGELETIAKKGKNLTVESRWTLVRNESGKPQKILVVDTDITEKKQLESQFLRAQRLESLGMLAGGIAHDMNNLLTPILGTAQLLPMCFPNLSEKQLRLVEVLDSSAQRGRDLVKQILTFARGVESQRIPIQIKHILAETRQIIQSTFPKSIEIALELQTLDLWIVLADVTQLHQVLVNLCVNARDAMPDGGKLKLSADNVVIDEQFLQMQIGAKVGNYVMLCVTDTGMGMPPEILDRIFDPFFTTKEIGKGTGLGLSTSLGIIQNHGGFINVDSQVSRGTQFKIYLPAEPMAEASLPGDEEIPTGQGELILVVDDEPLILEITKNSLESHNYRVLTACDGQNAIAIYQEYNEEIRAVLMDRMMPVMAGDVAILKLHQLNPNVNIIAMSGLMMPTLDLPIAALLPKPHTLRELLLTLHQILS